MRAWCALAIVFGATAGCDRVFGLDGRYPDAAVEEVDVTITNLQIVGTPPTIDETREVRATVHGPAMTRQTYVFVATMGTLVPSGGAIDVDASGDAVISSTYQPDQPGTVTLSAMAGSASATVMFDVLDLQVVGGETGTGATTISMNQYFGIKIRLVGPAEIRAVGLRASATTTAMGRFGVYADTNGQPAMRVVDLSTPQSIMPGRNVFATPFTMVPAGDYWLIGMFDRGVVVVADSSSSAPFGFLSGSYTNPMPPTLPGFGVGTSTQLAYFLVVVPQ